MQATALYRKDRSGSKATRWRYYQAFCYACDHLADTRNLQKVSNITPTHFREVVEYWKPYKAPNTIHTEVSGFRKYCGYAGCKHKMPKNKELKLPKREPTKYNRGWLPEEYETARELAECMRRFDVRDGLDLGWHLGLRIIEACQLKVKDLKAALNWGGLDIKGKGGQIRFVKIETEDQEKLIKRLYHEAKAKGLTDDDFVISKTISEGLRWKRSLSKIGFITIARTLLILIARRKSSPARSHVLKSSSFTVFVTAIIRTVRSGWKAIRESLKSSAKVWDTTVNR